MAEITPLSDAEADKLLDTLDDQLKFFSLSTLVLTMLLKHEPRMVARLKTRIHKFRKAQEHLAELIVFLEKEGA